jgi:hypothetical protein
MLARQQSCAAFCATNNCPHVPQYSCSLFLVVLVARSVLRTATNSAPGSHQAHCVCRIHTDTCCALLYCICLVLLQLKYRAASRNQPHWDNRIDTALTCPMVSLLPV